MVVREPRRSALVVACALMLLALGSAVASLSLAWLVLKVDKADSYVVFARWPFGIDFSIVTVADLAPARVLAIFAGVASLLATYAAARTFRRPSYLPLTVACLAASAVCWAGLALL